MPRKPVNPVMDGWESFAAAVLPPNASEVQVTEMRRAFFGGAWFMLTTFQAIGEDSVSEDEGVAVLELAKAEMEEFYRNVGMKY